jgi:COP9 signalosome complex subunit 6
VRDTSTPLRARTTLKGAMTRARSVHPLATVTICDHYARYARAPRDGDGGGANDTTRAMGLLYGTRKGASIDVVCALEVGTTTANGDKDVCGGFDFASARERAGLYAQTRGELEVVGYYRATASGALDDALDASMCRELSAHELVENGIVILVVRCGPGEAGDEGVEAVWYERVGAEAGVGTSADAFEQCEYTVETFEAERITVDEVSKIVPGSRDSYSARFGATLESAASATGALRDRLATVRDYLDNVKRGLVPCDYDLLRKIAGAMKTLRVNTRDEFGTSFADEYEDTLALNYLASLTKTTNELNEFIDKFQVVLSEQSANTRFQSRRNLG